MNYFDHNATTPIAPEVLGVLHQVQAEVFGNPSSIHAAGQQARRVVETARAQVAALLGCDGKEVVFTSGGTEADNLAVLGTPEGHVITAATEHPAVLAAVEQRGNATVLGVDANGLVAVEDLKRALRPDTVLVSIMHANNETGVVQPVAELAAAAHEAGALFHSDGVQAAGKLKIDVRALGVDLYSIAGHKFNAPKGVGALYVREGVKLRARQVGGRHERERRAGTENVAGIAALGAAAALAAPEVGPLREMLEREVLARIPGTRVHGAGAPRTPNTANISFAGVSAESLLIALDLAGFAVATGAACSSGATRPSHVLTAMGVAAEESRSSIRFSLGRGNTREQVEELVAALERAVARLRKLSPAHA
jgi:cysteine desulfurase